MLMVLNHSTNLNITFFLLIVKFSITMFLIGDFETVFNTEFVVMCMVYLHYRFHVFQSFVRYYYQTNK